MILIQQKFKKYRDINNFIVCTNNSHKSIHLLHSQIVNRENHFIVHYLYEEITKLVEQHILKHFQQKTTDSSIFSLKHIRCNECKCFKKKKKKHILQAVSKLNTTNKAFSRIRYCELFALLCDRNHEPPSVCPSLTNWIQSR